MSRRDTPWGMSDSATEYGEGVTFYTTPSHGGFYLSKEARQQIPQEWRDLTFNNDGNRGWFEEDCDACMVVVKFKDRFPDGMVTHAEKLFELCFAPKMEAAKAKRAVSHLPEIWHQTP